MKSAGRPLLNNIFNLLVTLREAFIIENASPVGNRSPQMFASSGK